MQPPYLVHKFGGTSLQTPERIEHARDLVLSAKEPARHVVVVSALGGVTDDLLMAIEAARSRSRNYRTGITSLRERHAETAAAVAPEAALESIREEMDIVWQEVEDLLDGMFLLGESTDRARAALLSAGERLSAPIMVVAFQSAGHLAVTVDARSIIRTDDQYGEAAVDYEKTGELVRAALQSIAAGTVVVVPGFTGATAGGETTTLGRSGSDYTATILAGALDARKVVIWTDVNGVLSADPRLVPTAFTLPFLSYREAAEMAYFGAKVLHPRTMRPIREKGIPLHIVNTLDPGAGGTMVEATSPETEGHVKAVTSVQDVALIMIEGSGMIGIPGVAARLFSALATGNINVLVISQASSEQSICVGIPAPDSERAVKALEKTFELELARRDIARIYALEDAAIVSVVGDYMRDQPGLAGRMFSTLGRANINVLAIAQGAAETNISAVISAADADRAVRALHEAFARVFERLHLFLIGPGGVGGKLLEILESQAERLKEKHHVNLRLVGVANSKAMVWDAAGIAFGRAAGRLADEGQPYDREKLLSTLSDSHIERLLVIDATASESVSDLYEELLSSRIAVVTPNKLANTGSQERFDLLRELSRTHDVPFLYETTAGAALPVIRTVSDLVRTGDCVRAIKAVLSGTLSFVFNRMAAGALFSEAVTEARAKGITEPDPRQDLAGEDVARKLLTLIREAGIPFERDQISVESLVPDSLENASVEEFMSGLSAFDDEWTRRMSGEPIHYVATFDDGSNDGEAGVSTAMIARVNAVQLDADSPFRSLRGTDNMIILTTDRYRESPLVIQGAGGGPELTASGILADILIAAERMR